MSLINAFPDELWMMVFRNVGRGGCAKLCRTCSRFRNIAEVDLYRAVILDFRIGSVTSCRGSLFERTLSERPGRALLVQAIHLALVSFDTEDKNKLASNNILRLLASPSFKNLRTLCLQKFHLDLDARSIFQSLPNLENFLVVGCTVDPIISSKPFKVTDSERKLNLSIHNLASGDGWNHIIPRQVQSLHVALCGPGILTNFTQSDQGCYLTTLDYGLTSTEPLLPLLMSTPQLRRIYLYDFINASTFSLPGTAIPLLESFNGPVELCGMFLTGRPVHTVDLHFHSLPCDTLSQQLSTVSVRDLTLRYPRKLNDVLRCAPVTIERLTCYGVTKEVLLLGGTVLGRFPGLHTFNGFHEVESGMPTRKYDFGLIKVFSEACVSLREVRLQRVSERANGRRWAKKYHGAWEYYPEEDMRIVVEW